MTNSTGNSDNKTPFHGLVLSIISDLLKISSLVRSNTDLINKSLFFLLNIFYTYMTCHSHLSGFLQNQPKRFIDFRRVKNDFFLFFFLSQKVCNILVHDSFPHKYHVTKSV